MLLHSGSGRTYSPNHLDMETKLDLILKELQDLKLRVEGLENKNKDESSRDDTRDRKENANRHEMAKMTPIDSIHDLKIFTDWDG